MGAGVRFTMLMCDYDSQQYFSVDEVDLKDGADLVISGYPAVRCEGGVALDFPVLGEMCRIGGAFFIAGGMLTDEDSKDFILGPRMSSTNLLWSAPPPPLPGRGSSTHIMNWTRCATTMESGRLFPMVVPLHDGRIFICGGTDVPEGWVEIYDPEKGEIDRKDLPEYIWNRRPASCFLWGDDASSKHHRHEPLVMLYYDTEPIRQVEDEHAFQPSLLLYNMEKNSWEIFADNLPIPEVRLFNLEKRNLIYVGDDILFIIDHASCWFIYDLSAKKEVGKVDVMIEDRVVLKAFYLPSLRNSESGSSSLIFYIFMPDLNDVCKCIRDIRYAKVEVVQRKGEDYIAKVQSSGILRVGEFIDPLILAEEVSYKRAAEEDCYMLESNKNMRGRDGARLVSPKMEDSSTDISMSTSEDCC